MNNIKKIIAEYEGKEFEVKIGEVYDFSDFPKFDCFTQNSLIKIDFYSDYPFFTEKNRFNYIRPIQTKPLTSEELYRICGKNGYEVRFNNVNEIYRVTHNSYCIDNITHFRKAYSQDEWKPIAEIERE